MDVLHVTPFFPPDKGGIANVVSNVCTNLSKMGLNISVVAPKHLIKRERNGFVTGSNRIVRIGSIFLLGWPYHTLRSISIPVDLGRRIDSIIRNGNFDIIHVHGHHYPISWIAINSAHRYRIPSVLWIHGMYALNPKVLGGKTRLEEWFNKYIFAKMLSKTDAVIGATTQVTNYARQIASQNATKYVTIPYGVDTLKFKENIKKKSEFRLKYNLRQDSIVLLFVGRLEYVKGVIEFAEAIKIIRSYLGKKVEVMIVGSGSLETKIRAILGNTEGVHLLPWMPPNNIYEIFIASDIFLLTSKFEAMPLTILEAMNASLHIVYTPVGGVSEMLQGYSRKTMLTNATVEEIKIKLKALLEEHVSYSDVDVCLTYAQKFDWQNISISVNQLYEQLRSSSKK